MTKVVHKVFVPLNGTEAPTPTPLPVHAKLLLLASQNNVPALWYETDTRVIQYKNRYFQWVGTGHTGLPDKSKYVGTIFQHDGAFVFHCYEVYPEDPE